METRAHRTRRIQSGRLEMRVPQDHAIGKSCRSLVYNMTKQRLVQAVTHPHTGSGSDGPALKDSCNQSAIKFPCSPDPRLGSTQKGVTACMHGSTETVHV